MAVLVYRSQPQDVRDVLKNAHGTAAGLKHRWEVEYRPQYTTVDQPAEKLVNIVDDLRNARDMWAMALARPGINEAAQIERGPSYDFVAEFTALLAAAEAVLDWTKVAWNANVSNDYKTIGEDYRMVVKKVTVQQLSDFVTRMDAMTALITFIDG